MVLVFVLGSLSLFVELVLFLEIDLRLAPGDSFGNENVYFSTEKCRFGAQRGVQVYVLKRELALPRKKLFNRAARSPPGRVVLSSSTFGIEFQNSRVDELMN